jgi:isoleucyl-tRNA synthetase
VKRRLLVLWNTYSFFVTYANIDGWTPEDPRVPTTDRPLLDRWVVARLSRLVVDVRSSLDRYDATAASRAIEAFIEELSTWYVRRSRRRFWKSEDDLDKRSAYATLYECLTTLTALLAPFMPFLSEVLYQNLVRRVCPSAPLSVHLTSYPVRDESSVESSLLAAMETAQRTVALGRAARERAGIKVRQPLAAMHVRAPSQEAEAAIRQLREIILDELNVKQLHFARSEDEFVAYDVRPNLPVLGPRYGKRVPQIRLALQTLDPAAVARAVEHGLGVEITFNGDILELMPHEVLAEAREKEGYAAMAADGYLVVLDTRLDRALTREGLAREVVRRINDWRRAAGFEIEDRIAVRYDASPELATAIEEHRDYICREILATSLVAGPPEGNGFQAQADFDRERLTVELTRT